MTLQAVTSASLSNTLSSRKLQIEDSLGKTVILIFFLWQFYKTAVNALGMMNAPVFDFHWAMMAVANLTTFGFLTMIVWLTVTRSPVKETAAGFDARLSAFMGTFILIGLIAVPHAPISDGQLAIATWLIVAGSVGSIYCLWWLGRAFSVMASARHLVTAGPYSHVRHPLYTAEALTVIGVVLLNGSSLAAILGLVQFYFQYRRMLHEEAVLGRVFPEYADYKTRTPMVLPHLL